MINISSVLVPRLNYGFFLFVTLTSRVHDICNQHGCTHITESCCLHRGTSTMGALVTKMAGVYYKWFSVPLSSTLQQTLRIRNVLSSSSTIERSANSSIAGLKPTIPYQMHRMCLPFSLSRLRRSKEQIALDMEQQHTTEKLRLGLTTVYSGQDPVVE